MTHTIQPVTDADISPASRAILQQIEDGANVGWKFFLTAAHSPSALEALHGLVRAATKTRLPERVRVAIALHIAQLNGCEYCVATHTDRARGAGLDDASVLNYRRGISNDPKEQALLSLATKVVQDRGHHAGFAVQFARNAGATDAEMIEVIQLVTLSIFSDYLNNLAGTELDGTRIDLTLDVERTV